MSEIGAQEIRGGKKEDDIMLHFPTSCYWSVNFSMSREDEMSSGKK